MKVRAYLALMAAAIFVPLTVFSAAALQAALYEEREAALRGVRETARATAIGVDRELAGAIAALRVLGASAHLASGDLKSFYYQALAASQSEDSWTVLFDRQGQQLINTRAPFGATLPKRSHPERGEEVIRTKRPHVSNLITGRFVGSYLIAIDVPVPLDGGMHYVLDQAFSTDYFERAFPYGNVSPDWIIRIIDRDGNIIARSSRAAQLVGSQAAKELLDAARNAKEGVVRHSSREGIEVYDVFTRSSLSGWTIAVGVPVDRIEAAARRSVIFLALGLLAAIVCAVVAAVYFGRRLAHAILTASDRAAALGRGEVPPAATTNVAEFDALHQALHQAGEVLARERASRERAEAEREQMFAAEQEARRIAESQNQAKDEFIAMLGHELRNPLSAITTAVALLETQSAGEERASRARGVIARQSRHLARIVDDLLDLSRVISGKVYLERHRIDLGEVVRSCASTLKATHRINRHVVRLHLDTVWIDADPTRIEQIINNLLLNAAKYTPAGGSIDIAAGAEDGEAVLTVRDSGVGISAQLLPNIFDVFVQGPTTLDRAEGGLGIGLALVRRLVRLHGGSVLASSAGDGTGSTFIVRLPLAAEPKEKPGRPATALAVKCRVLLIDDNEDGRQTLAALLAMQGHQVLEAGDGHQGLALAESGQPEVAVVDIGLPGIDGYEIARRLLAAPGTRHIRLIALTGYGQPADRERALDAGFDMYLIKPVEPARLADAISTLNHARL